MMVNMSDESSVDEPSVFDNIETVMSQLAENMTARDMQVSSEKDSDETADKQVIVRATKTEHERWKRAAEVEGTSLSQMVRDLMNKKATSILDCNHPREYRKTYPWSDTCTKCGTRLRG